MSNVSLRDVACFTQVARWRSFSRAASHQGMSQSAVSQAIARLERALNLRLFERTSREVRLTRIGDSLLPHAEALIEQAASFGAEAARLAAPPGQTIRLAYSPVIGTFAAQVARRLAHRSPAIEVELQPAGWHGVTADLARGALSAALMNAPFPSGLAVTARFLVPITHLAVPAGDPLAGTVLVRLRQVSRSKILVPRSLWEQLTRGLREDLRTRMVSHDIDDLTAALDLVAAGQGVLPVPGLLVDTVRRPDVRFVPLDAENLRLTYGLVWRRERASAELNALVHAVQEILRDPRRVRPHRA